MFGGEILSRVIAAVGLSVSLSMGTPSASFADDAAPVAAATAAKDAEPATTKDPQIALDDLELLLAPMTKEETETEAKGWFALLRAKEREITAAELDVRRKNREIAQLEKQNAPLLAGGSAIPGPQGLFGTSSIAPVRNSKPAAPAPMSGAMMNSQSCATAPGFEPIPDQRRADRAGRIDRGAGDVDADQMDDDQRQSNGEAGEAGRRERMGDAEDAHQKQERRHHFEHEGGNDSCIRRGSPRPSRSGRAPPFHP